MLVRTVNLFFLIFCAKLCISQGKDVNEMDYWQFKQFVNEQMALLRDRTNPSSFRKLVRKFDQSFEGKFDIQEEREFFLGNIKCSRYSVEKKTSENSEERNNRFMNLCWNLTVEENATVSVTIPISNRSTLFSKTSIPIEKRGQLYFVANCNFSRDEENATKDIRFFNDINQNFKSFTKSPGQLYKSHEILVEKRNLQKTTEVSFFVKKSVKNLNIIVLGNIAKVDLKIPDDQETLLEWNETAKMSDLMRSLKRMTETKGLRLNLRNPPPGEWFFKLTPKEGSNYHFIVATVFNNSTSEEKILFEQDDVTKDEFKEEDIITAESRYNEKILQKPMDYEIMDNKSKNGNISSNKPFSKLIQLGNYEDEARHWKTPEEGNENWQNTSNIQIDVKNSKESAQETSLDSRIAIPDEEYNNEENNNDNLIKILSGPQIEERINHESLELQDFVRDSSDDFFQKQVVSVDLSSDSNLIVRSGAGRVTVNFDIRNNQLTVSLICYLVDSTPLRVTGLYVPNPYLSRNCHAVSPGQLVTVAVEIFVPDEISDTVNSITLSAVVRGLQIKTIRKTANLYIQNTNIRKVDDTRPFIKYYFNNNCGGHLREDRCSKSIWSVEIIVQDVDSGLKSVTSSPHGIQARTEYVTGTTNPVSFFYYASCCHKTVDISAVDMYGNYDNRRIDVTEWDNLSVGEIVAIVMGVLFLILLIILIVLLIVYCVKRNKSRDLPYTQRYGSGPSTQRPERTSF